MRVVAPGVYLLTGIGSAHQRPRGNRRLFMDAAGSLVPDPFDHELMMVVHDDDGMVVFSGCSHHGILNLIDAARAQFPRVPIKAVFGGFHLIGLPFYNSMAASRAEVRDIGWQVMEKVEGTVYSGHCTGQKAFDVLAGVMGENLKALNTGAIVEV
jgi:7,8-dihydropterin-6-yl-methyl-4-(beta-D-ribofuranosyl)aminobenzene 5'-phosphate synthase